MAVRQRSFWGWGYEGEGPSEEQRRAIAGALAERFGVDAPDPATPPRLEDLDLRQPRLSPPSSLEQACSQSPYERALHSYGRSFRDVVRGLAGDFGNPPDVVAYPANEDELCSLLDWAGDQGAAVIPFGGGSSVVGGVEPAVGDSYAGTVTVDLSRMDRVLEIDRESRAARIQAGVYGPALEDQLRPHGLTLRHFPQSFEFSTLGGWIATRSGGHYATLYTHIDDFVESLRVITPSGSIESRRLPGSGAGPSPDRMFIGSEGTLGIITEAWMRLRDRPSMRASASLRFTDYEQAWRAVQAVSQSGLYPANLRLLDKVEAALNGAGNGDDHVLIVGFESADHPPDAWMARALECCRDHGASHDEGAGATRGDQAGNREGAAGAWRKSFLQAPYLRDALVAMGFISETFETAITWDRFEQFHSGIIEAVNKALADICGGGQVTCRFTHVYPDGPAPYFSIIAPARAGAQLQQWAEIKAVAAAAVIDLGGSITHHHAVGRDHRPWYEKQRPDGFAGAMLAARAEMDPTGMLNPGVLFKAP